MLHNLNKDWPVYLIILGVLVIISRELVHYAGEGPVVKMERVDHWEAPSLYYDHTLAGEERDMVIYGEDLIANTSKYLGPRGIVQKSSNGMNCQNCHLQAGTLPWGNNYSAVYSTYPKFRERSGAVETISKRVNDCFERSLNGKAIDTNGKEMRAIIAYLRWLGQDVKKGERPAGVGIRELKYLDRAADPGRGKQVFTARCQSCHGPNGEGTRDGEGLHYIYPPLWGDDSYNTGAGLYRISRFAGFVKDNMPFKLASHAAPILTDEEAWDVAAYVNSQPRPIKDPSSDWPDISKKPVDHPFGPYADGFDEIQHKYGPFPPIVEARKKLKSGTGMAIQK